MAVRKPGTPGGIAIWCFVIGGYVAFYLLDPVTFASAPVFAFTTTV